MKRISSVFFAVTLAIVGCGRINSALDNANTFMPMIKDLKDNTGHTNEFLTILKDGVHNQTLKDALDEAFSDRAIKYYPLPTGYDGPAQKFAATASTEELVQQTELWQWQVDLWQLKEVNQDLGTYPFNIKKIDAQITKLKATEGKTPDPQIDSQIAQLEQSKTSLHDSLSAKWKSYNLDKHITLGVLGAIAGLAPQSTVEQIYHEQVEGGRGSYHRAGLAFMAVRADFIFNNLFALKSSTTTNADELALVVQYAQQLDYIAQLPEAGDLQLITTGMFLEDPDKANKKDPSPATPKVAQVDLEVSNNLNPNIMQSVWDTLKTVESGLETAKLGPDQKAQLPGLAATINQRDQYWSAKAAATP